MTFTKGDAYAIAGLIFLTTWLPVVIAIYRKGLPSIDSLTALASLFNTKGGIVLALWAAWFVTLFTTIFFGVWVIRSGVDPQHLVVVSLMGMLSSNAFGAVGGALFRTMTGEEPKNGNGKGAPLPTPVAPAT